MPIKAARPRLSKEEALLRLQHLQKEYDLAETGMLFGGGFVVFIVMILGNCAALPIASNGYAYPAVVLIAAAALIMYFALVFGRMAQVKAKIKKTQIDLGLKVKEAERFPQSSRCDTRQDS